MKWSSNAIYRYKGDDKSDDFDQQSASKSNLNKKDDPNSSRPIYPDYLEQKDDPNLLKPIHPDERDEGGSTGSRERKLGIFGKLGLLMGALSFFASPILALAIIFPILHSRYSKISEDDDKLKKPDSDLQSDQIDDRLQRVEDIQDAINRAKLASRDNDLSLPNKFEASGQQTQANQVGENPLNKLPKGKVKPILKKPYSPVSNASEGDAHGLVSPSTQINTSGLDPSLNQASSRAQASGSSSQSLSSRQIQGLDLASDQSSKPVPAGAKQSNLAGDLAGDLAGIAKDLTGDPRPTAGKAKPKGRVRFGPVEVR